MFFFNIRAQYLRFVNSPSTYHQLSSIFHEIFVSCKFSGEINPYRLDMTRSFIWNVTELFCLWHPRARKAFWRLEQVMQRDKLKRFPVPLPRLDTWPGEVLSLPELLWFVFLIVEEKNMFLRPPKKNGTNKTWIFWWKHEKTSSMPSSGNAVLSWLGYRMGHPQFVDKLWFQLLQWFGCSHCLWCLGVDSKLRWQGKIHG